MVPPERRELGQLRREPSFRVEGRSHAGAARSAKLGELRLQTLDLPGELRDRGRLDWR